MYGSCGTWMLNNYNYFNKFFTIEPQSEWNWINNTFTRMTFFSVFQINVVKELSHTHSVSLSHHTNLSAHMNFPLQFLLSWWQTFCNSVCVYLSRELYSSLSCTLTRVPKNYTFWSCSTCFQLSSNMYKTPYHELSHSLHCILCLLFFLV